jgi:hypothetical protein
MKEMTEIQGQRRRITQICGCSFRVHAKLARVQNVSMVREALTEKASVKLAFRSPRCGQPLVQGKALLDRTGQNS